MHNCISCNTLLSMIMVNSIAVVKVFMKASQPAIIYSLLKLNYTLPKKVIYIAITLQCATISLSTQK